METGILEDLEQSIENFNTIIVAAGITHLITGDDLMLKLKDEAVLARGSCERMKDMIECAKLGE